MELSSDKKVSSEQFDLSRALKVLVRHWWWYVISLAVCLFCSWLYLHIKAPRYRVSSVVMLNQNDEGGNSGTLGALGSLMSSFSLGGSGGVSMDDELIKMKSHTNLISVIKALGINNSYWDQDGRLSTKINYYNDAPVVAEMPSAVADTTYQTIRFFLTSDNGKLHLKGSQGKHKNFIDKDIPSLPYSVKVPSGAVVYLRPTASYNPREKMHLNILLQHPTIYYEYLAKELTVDKISKKANAIYLEIDETVPERGEDVLNTVVDLYNERSLATSHALAQATSDFLENRLIKMYKDLEGSEIEIEKYKKANNIVDAEAEAEYIFKKRSAVEGELIEAETKVAVLRMVRDFLGQEENKYKLIPFAADMPEKPIEAYNELVLTRIRLESNARGDNSTLSKVSKQIDAMRDNLLVSLEREMASAHIAVNDMNRENNKSLDRMSGMPTMERELRALYRDQVIKNQIYGFLLQKREENQMKLARNLPTAQVLDAAHTKYKPVSPNNTMVYAMGALFGLAIPTLLLIADSRSGWTGRLSRRKK